MPTDLAQLASFSLGAYLLVFFGGVVTSIGPCNVAMIPLIIGYVGGRDVTRGRSLALSTLFVVGLSITFVLLGLLAAAVGALFGWVGKIWYYVVAAICIVIGLQLLGLIHIPVPALFARQRDGVKSRGLAGAFLLGLVSGLVSSQCATPVLVAILTYVMAKGAMAYGATLLFAYALGRGVPIVLAGTFAGLARNLSALGRWTSQLERVSGVIIIGVGLYFLWIA
ncbi:MAG: cytochrome c biogenesis CcdA family protein [Anaerolineae bacterium]